MIDPEAWELLDRSSQYSSRLTAMIADIKLEQLSTEQAIIRLSLILSLSQALRDDIKTFQAVTRIARE
ncbi:MAG: hypothetical protein ABF755_07300 [Oenococcus oeni]|uniref:hypothetical protein n=1 Tax=Oenococcus oeni TaxID=1247 RepID=UPI0008F7FC5C|nr:hypothetical protein [Oenococcus oeni]OIM23067.1 hypothetical protein ATX60_06125 [Oenococcus oeni]